MNIVALNQESKAGKPVFRLQANEGQPCICNSTIHGHCVHFMGTSEGITVNKGGMLENVPMIECSIGGKMKPPSHCTGRIRTIVETTQAS